MEKGALIGHPVQGVRVVLEDGQTHTVDSSDMAFRFAALSAVREAIMKAGAQVLEPVMSVEVRATTLLRQLFFRRVLLVRFCVVNMLQFPRAARALPRTALKLDESQTTNVVLVVNRVGWCRCTARALRQHSMPIA